MFQRKYVRKLPSTRFLNKSFFASLFMRKSLCNNCFLRSGFSLIKIVLFRSPYRQKASGALFLRMLFSFPHSFFYVRFIFSFVYDLAEYPLTVRSILGVVLSCANRFPNLILNAILTLVLQWNLPRFRLTFVIIIHINISERAFGDIFIFIFRFFFFNSFNKLLLEIRNPFV